MDIVSHSAHSNKLLAAALEYASRGWSIIPVNGKKSVGAWKRFQTNRPDERALRQLFARNGVTGLGVILGSSSGDLACRDFDTQDSYKRWAAEYSNLAATLPTVITSRGRHVYFRGPATYKDLGDGEYRGDAGHYCILPPSHHPSGAEYKWQVPLPDDLPYIDPIAAGLLPDWPLQRDARTQTGPAAKKSDTSPALPHPHVMCKQVKLPNELLSTLPTGPGQRNGKLFFLARRLKQIMPDASLVGLTPIIHAWYELALPVIRTKSWATTWTEFTHAWRSVKYPASGRWDEIVTAARSITILAPGFDGAAAMILQLCAALHAHHGAGVPFPLSCRMAAGVAKVSEQRAATVLRTFVGGGILELANPAGRKGSRRAAAYRFKAEQLCAQL